MTNFLRNQNTISKTASLDGVGYWSGLNVHVEFRPAPVGSGITFIRADLAGQPRIQVCTENGIDIPRRTSMQNGPASVEMIEHIMATLTGLQIDNCEVWVDRAEIPALDGSSRLVVEALSQVELVAQHSPKPTFQIEDEIRIDSGDSWIKVVPTDQCGLTLTYELDYQMPSIGQQAITLDVNSASFINQLASARTFILDTEAEWLRSQGLGRQVSFQDLLVFGPEGVIDNHLRFPDECVRHKALDVVGDLAVAGFDIHGCVTAHKSGHRLNGMFVRELVDAYQAKTERKMSA